MVYHNLNFWRRVHVQAPHLTQQVQDIARHAEPSSRSLYGPFTILQQDVSWLGCEIDVSEALLKHRDVGQISFYEPDHRKFAHFVRQLIRQRHFSALEAKHGKWQGAGQTDIEATTKLLRSLEPSCPYKNPLIRLLSDAHATPYRLHKMNIKQTPHCQFCLHEEGTIEHSTWNCPRFANLRLQWPSELLNRDHWPECSSHAMICTDHLPAATRESWPQLQLHVAQLLWQWMEQCRNPELYEQFSQKPQLQTSSESSQDGNVFRSKNQQTSLTRTVHALPLKWNPPSTRTSWNKWGSTARDFALLFSFWSKWTTQPAEAATPVRP